MLRCLEVISQCLIGVDIKVFVNVFGGNVNVLGPSGNFKVMTKCLVWRRWQLEVM